MAISLTVTDGTSTVTLTGTDAYLENFEHIAGDVLATSVVERQNVSFFGGNSTIETNLLKLNRLFLQARRFHEDRILPQVFINFCLDGSVTWRSEIFSGEVISTGNIVKYERALGVRAASVIWERAPYWEGPEAQIPLTNGNDEDNITGLTVWNHNDSTTGHDNYVTIQAEDVAGDLPAPCRIEIENTFNSATGAYTYYIGQAWESGWPDALTLNVLEAEDADSPTTGNTSSASFSGGAYKTLVLPATAGLLVRWDLSTDVLTACKGNWFRLMAAFDGTPAAATWVKAKLTFPAGVPLTVVAESPWVQLDGINTLQEVGTLQIPPWLPGETSLAGLTLSLYGYNASEGTQRLDYMQLFPMDGFRKLKPVGYGLAYEGILVDDGISGSLYADLGGEKAGYYVGTGEIKLQPGFLQRLYFLCTSQTGGSGIDRTASVKIFYRPRRAGL